MLLTVLVAPPKARAQSWRVQGAWVAGHVGGIVVGAEARHPVGPEPPLPLPGVEAGPVEVAVRNWILTGMAAGGVNLATPAGEDDVQPLFYGHAGVLYRTGSDVLSRVGAVGLFYVPAGAVGPAALLEAAGVIDLQGGALYTSTGWRGHAALTLSLHFLCDVLCGGGG
ncbi:MAG TPA: hypothetical protein VE173_04200 [Longimicrobiales bacterium]|nr:hypothetical protein [Longimicrobiales bacterium]